MVVLTREHYIKIGEDYVEKEAYGTSNGKKLQQSEEDIAQMIETIKGFKPDFFNRHKHLFQTNTYL